MEDSNSGGSSSNNNGSSVYRYDFETGTEGWTNPDGTYGWRRNSGNTPSGPTGPSRDDTLGTTAGYYYYMEASNGQGPFNPTLADSFLESTDFWRDKC